MTQHQAQLCHSSWGRILLSIRLDWGLYGRRLLIEAGLFALCCFCLPRLGMFFGQSIEDFAYDYLNRSSHYYYNALFIGYGLGFSGWLAYCNRRVQHTLSSAFALMPLRLSEHIASALIFGVWIWVAVWLSVQVSQLLSWLTLPVNPDLYWHALPIPRPLGLLHYAIQTGSGSLAMLFVNRNLALLLVMLVGLWASLRFRSLVKGWSVWLIVTALGALALIAPMLLLRLPLVASEQQIRITTDAGTRLVTVQSMSWDWVTTEPDTLTATYLCAALLCLIALVLWRIRHTLKTIAR